MRIKNKIKNFRIYFFLLLFTIYAIPKVSGQVVWENYRNEVYNYLSRMADKGFINFDDVIKPLTRTYIAKNLQALSLHTEQLSTIEKKELKFYLQEYWIDLDTTQIPSSPVTFIKKDRANRWRAFNIKSKNFLLNADPFFQGAGMYNGVKNFIHQSIGANLWGQIGNHFGFQLSVNDISENRDGRGIDSFLFKQSQPGYVLLGDKNNHQNLNYTDLRASLGYSWKNGSISFGQDYLLWGYGINGKIILSDKSPAYPYIRLDYQPFKWLKFQYTHAWLSSNIVDSNRTYSFGNTVYGGSRIFYIQKFMASHTITFKPIKSLDISLGESIVYSDQINIGYLIPVMFFKVYDNLTSSNNILAGSNGQLFFQVSSRNMLKKTHLYSTLFIDEIRVAQVFNRNKSRNQLGFNLGVSVTDIFIPYLTLNAEYTRVNPFVYSNLNPVQNYTNHQFNLGDWMGNNFDRITLSANYTPLPKLKCNLRYQYSRKGGAGTINQQYFAEPQPPFLFDLQYTEKEIFITLTYQWTHNLYLNIFYNSIQQNNKISNQITTTPTAGVGFSYGL